MGKEKKEGSKKLSHVVGGKRDRCNIKSTPKKKNKTRSRVTKSSIKKDATGGGEKHRGGDRNSFLFPGEEISGNQRARS